MKDLQRDFPICINRGKSRVYTQRSTIMIPPFKAISPELENRFLNIMTIIRLGFILQVPDYIYR